MSDKRDFLAPTNHYAVELFARGWHPWTAHPTLAGARIEADRRIRMGYPVRIIDLATGRIVQ